MRNGISVVTSFANSSSITNHYLENIKKVDVNLIEGFIFAVDGKDYSDTLNLLTKFKRDQKKEVKILRNDIPLGYSKTINSLVNLVDTEYVLLMDSDVLISSECIEKMLDVVSSPNIASVQPLLIYPQTKKIQSYGHVFGPMFNNHAYKGRDFSELFPLKSRKAQGITTACQIFKKNIFIEVGGLDERYYNAYEGLELSINFRKIGYETHVIGDTYAYHFQGGSRSRIKFSESISTGLFWSKWGNFLKSDFVDKTEAKRMIPNSPIYILNASSLQDWSNIFSSLDINIVQEDTVSNRGTTLNLWEDLPLSANSFPGVVLILCDHFEQATANAHWYECRSGLETIILDLHGNILSR